MNGWGKAGLFAGGAVAVGLLQAASRSKGVRNVCVQGVASILRANDAVQEHTQNIMDAAEDVRAEADRERLIQNAVDERLADIKEQIRAEVIAEMDGTAPVEAEEESAPAPKAAKKA